MNDKPSARVTARPPMPSIAPPTDDIDAEWGADDIPAAAPLPTLAAASVAPPASPSVAPPASPSVAPPASPSSVAPPPAPHLETPLPRPPSASRPPSAPRRSSVPPPPLALPSGALRKQTLLGVAPPPALPVAAPVDDNPLRKQTLLGVAPPPDPRAEEPSGVAAPAVAASDAPTTLEVERRPAPVISWPPPEPASSPTNSDELTTKPSRARWLVPLGVAAALGLAVGAKQLTPARESAPPPVAATKVTPRVEEPRSEPPAVSSGDAAEPPPPTVTPAATSSAPTPAAEPATSPAPPRTDVMRIQVNSDPPGARLFWKGKPVGTTPFVLELAAGEKHAYEMGMPGYNTRKVVVDGTKTEINIGLKPEPGAFIGAKPRKP